MNAQQLQDAINQVENCLDNCEPEDQAAFQEIVSHVLTLTPIQPIYYVTHPDGSFSVADPQPMMLVRP